MKKKQGKVKRGLCLLWYTPWVWFAEICKDKASNPEKAEKAIRHWTATSALWFSICILTSVALIYVWKVMF